MNATQKSRGPGLFCPPPLVYVAVFLIGLLLEQMVIRLRVVSGGAPEVGLAVVGIVVTAFGVGVVAWGMLTFRKARTSIITIRPATTLVRHGPYRYTRNPMYIGLTIAYVGVALAMNSGWTLVVLPLAMYAMYRLVIRREERYLSAEFGSEYAEYRQRVRRWI